MFNLRNITVNRYISVINKCITVKSLLKILYPFSLIYGFVTWIRNKLFDYGVLTSHKMKVPVISVGNLTVGGTGKTPHIEYLIRYFYKHKRIAVISRGYGRKSNGFRYVDVFDNAINVGDEPLQIKQKFRHCIVAVGEKRVPTLSKVLADHPDINLVLLDDAFQHRYIKRDLNILLTDYKKPFWRDTPLPSGRLREFPRGWQRADMIIITKCPEKFNLKIPSSLLKKPLYHSRINYQTPQIIHGDFSKNVILITGIVNPGVLVQFLLSQNFSILRHFNFTDHHLFKPKDIHLIIQVVEQHKNCLILTTEKDWMRLKPFLLHEHYNIGFIPIEVSIENAPDWNLLLKE